MAEEKKRRGRHMLVMEERERVRITGVTDVLSFDEEGIMLETDAGLLIIKGEGLHVGMLDLEAGEVTIEGTADSASYADGGGGERRSFLGKLFR